MCDTFGISPAVRSEGQAEMMGDLVVRCTGGTVPSTGAALPKFDIVVTLGANITSRRLQDSLTEALLFVDDPVPAQQAPCAPSTGSSVCTGLTMPAAYNVFQGVARGANSLVFLSVPLTAPGAGGRIFRIKNIRAEAASVRPADRISATVSLENAPSNVQLRTSTAQLAFLFQGIQFAVRNARGDAALDTAAPGVSLGQCDDWNAAMAADSAAVYTNERSYTLRFTESFAASYTIKETSGQQNLPTFPKGFDDAAANTFTESGFFNTAFPATNGLNRAGRADHGTRLRVTFANVPANVRVFVSAHSLRRAAYGCIAGRCSGSAEATDGFAAYAVDAAATSGAEAWNHTVAGSDPLPSLFPTGAKAGSVEVPVTAGTGTFTWEVYAHDPRAVDVATFAVSFAIRKTNPPGAGAISANGGFGPLSATALPRFADYATTAIDTARVVAAVCPPILISLSPASVQAATGAFQLAVTGVNFTAASVIRWNSSDRATTFVNSALVRAQILASDITTAGSATIGVTNGSNTLPFTIRPGPPPAPSAPSPADGALAVPPPVTLTWTGPNSDSYDVYFGTNSFPGYLASVQTPAFSPGALNAGATYFWRIVARNVTGQTSSPVWRFTVQQQTTPPTGGLRFVPITPCRLVDTRVGQGTTGAFGPPSLAAGSTRSLPVPTGRCVIPTTAKAYALNATAVPRAALSYLTLWPTGQDQPLVSTLNSFHGGVVSNAAIVPAGTAGAISVFATNETDFILDINGYFDSSTGSSFYTVDPCRAADTRTGGSTRPPANSTRNYLASPAPCSLPATATGYSLNITAVPVAALSYLTIWPSGQAQPFVSTLNSFDGAIVANAALVPAGANGAVSVFVTDAADTILDTNGYFGPPGATGELQFYPLTPCRVIDTRISGSGSPALGASAERDFAISGKCGVPVAAKAYSLNATVVPPGPLSFLTLWPAGKARPLVSTLNSFLGRVVANAAIVPAGPGGVISAFATNETHLILDINGYFQ